MIQWGTETVSGSPRSYLFKKTMPLPFTNTNTYTLLISPEMWANDTTQRVAFIGEHRLTSQTFSAHIYGNGTSDTITSLQWFAIGY